MQDLLEVHRGPDVLRRSDAAHFCFGGSIQMTKIHSRRVRMHALAAATALALFSVSGLAAERINISGLQSAPSHDRFIVKYRDGSAQQSSEASLNNALGVAAAAARGGKALGLQKLRRIATGAEVVQSSRKLDSVEAEMLMRQIAADPDVEYVEVDQLMQPILTPNDTRYSEQYGFFEATGGIKANEAWDISTGSGVVVAVLDTGSTNHSDLNANLVAGYDMISDATVAGDGGGRDSDPSDPGDYYQGSNSSWHGTHVAGTLAAVTNNGKGVAGTAFGAKVQHVRVLGRGGGFTSDIADGIIWASGGSISGVPANATPAEVINMSLGGSGSCSSTYQNAINAAVGRGTTVVVAAGNSNANVSTSVPANCSNVIAVAATDRNGARASFSNYGTGIDVSGPGVGILSTLNSGTTSPGSESYASYNGTSMAAPHVAGVIALLQSRATTPKSPAEIESLLKSTARALPGACSGGCGAGIVNAKAALDAVNGGTTPPPAVRRVPYDVNGDGRSDVFLRGDTALAYWAMNGTTRTFDSYLGNGGTGWRVVAFGDFDGAAGADVLWANGSEMKIWFNMGGGSYVVYEMGSYGNGFEPFAAADVNGDGKSDILLRSGTAIAYWLLDGATVIGNAYAGDGGAGFQVVTTGDFTGDGADEIVWASATEIKMWVNGRSAGYSPVIVGTYGNGFVPFAAGYVDGDSSLDLLFRGGTALAYWKLNGSTMVSSAYLGDGGAGYAPFAVGDYNGDGTSDIGWQNGETIKFWMNNGAGDYTPGIVGNYNCCYEPIGNF